MKKIFSVALVSCSLFFSSSLIMSATEKNTAEIIAVVGQAPITKADLESRITLILLTSHMPVNESTKNALREQVLKNMIEEMVQLETAKKYKVIAKEGEIDTTLAAMAKEMGTTLEGLKKMLEEHKVPFSSIRERVKAQLSWLNFVRGAFSHHVHISDKDVEAYRDQKKKNESKDQYEVAEIFIRVDDPSGFAAAEKQANHLIQQIKAGAHFKAVAQQFSSSPSASGGGYLGWMTEDHEGASVFKALEPGQISAPHRTSHGFYIYYMLDKKPAGQTAMGDALITIKQVTLKGTEGFKREEDALLVAKFDEFMETSSVSSFEKVAASHNIPVETMTDKPLSTLAPEFRNVPVGKVAKPLFTNDGVMLMIVCERKPGKPKPPRSDGEVKSDLENERLSQRAILQLSQLMGRTYIKLQNPQDFPSLHYGKNVKLSEKGAAVAA